MSLFHHSYSERMKNLPPHAEAHHVAPPLLFSQERINDIGFQLTLNIAQVPL
jgi:hypothetical protein